MKIAMLDIGGTTIKSGEFSDRVLGSVRETDTDALKGGLHVIENAKRILSEYKDFERIGISTAGQVDSKQGTIRYANSNIPEYTGMEVKKILEKEFGVPVAVENDVNAAAVGEANFGAGKKYKDFLCLTYGTGVGGAIIINKEIYKGSCFSAGEFGGIVVHAGNRNAANDIFSGCYEQYASVTALVKNAAAFDANLKNGRIIFERLNEEPVKSIVDEWIKEIVYGLVTLTHIFNPSCIVLGGAVMNQKYILDNVNNILYNHIMDSYHTVVVRQAELGNNAGLLGAAQIAMEMK